jgi:hypothetical protein
LANLGEAHRAGGDLPAARDAWTHAQAILTDPDPDPDPDPDLDHARAADAAARIADLLHAESQHPGLPVARAGGHASRLSGPPWPRVPRRGCLRAFSCVAGLLQGRL